MTELVGALVGFYIAFNWRWLWTKFTKATDEERVSFGVLCFVVSLCVFWWTL